MAKVVGYVLALIGLVIVALSNIISTKISFLMSLGKKGLAYTVVAGVVFVVIGIVLVMSESSSRNIKQAAEEVPIYQGEGKKRKIVGYKKSG